MSFISMNLFVGVEEDLIGVLDICGTFGKRVEVLDNDLSKSLAGRDGESLELLRH